MSAALWTMTVLWTLPVIWAVASFEPVRAANDNRRWFP